MRRTFVAWTVVAVGGFPCLDRFPAAFSFCVGVGEFGGDGGALVGFVLGLVCGASSFVWRGGVRACGV